MPERPDSKTMKLVSAVFLLIAVGFLLWFVAGHHRELARLLIEAHPVKLLFSFSLFVAFVSLQGFLGAWMLRSVGCTAPLLATYPVILLSLLGKYIPGKIWVVTMRYASLSRQSISLGNILAGSIVEHVFVVATGIMLFFMTSGSRAPQSEPLFLLLALGLFSVFVFFPGLILKGTNTLLRLAGRAPLEQWPSRRQNVLYMVYYLGTWFILGGGVFLLADGLSSQLPLSSYLPITGGYALSVILGFIAFFAPGGIGVREGIFVLILTAYMPPVQAVFISVTTRILFSLAELSATGMVFLVIGLFNRSASHGNREPAP